MNTHIRTMGSLIIVVLTVCLLTGIAVASDPIPAPPQKKPIALIGGTVHPVVGKSIPGGTILFDKGRIVAIGTHVAIPADAERVDVTGKHVYPGLVLAHSNLGILEIPLGAPGTDDVTEPGAINPNLRAEVAVHPESELIPVARSAGIAVAVAASGGGLIRGLAAAMETDGWTWEEMTLKSGVGLVIDWPSMVYSPSPFSRQSKEEWVKQRDENLQAIREAFAHAHAYKKAKDGESTKGIPYHDTDRRWEAMIPVLEGTVPVIVFAHELTGIQSAVTWAEQEKVRLIILGGGDSWRVAEQLKAKDIPVIITGTLVAPMRRWEAYNTPHALAGKLHRAGVRFCISGQTGSDAGSNARYLSHHAATAAAHGLPSEEALKAITIYPSQILGIAGRVGSLDVGKDATLMITDGDPLELTTTVEQVYIRGKKSDMRDRHKQLYGKYQEKYRQLK